MYAAALVIRGDKPSATDRAIERSMVESEPLGTINRARIDPIADTNFVFLLRAGADK